jgi:hypothetical protein
MKRYVIVTSNIGHFLVEEKEFDINDYKEDCRELFRGTEEECYTYQIEVMKLNK